MAPQAAATLVGTREQRRAARATETTRPSAPAATANLGPQLPGAVADRLAGLMAADPGLAEAVSARLPAARLQSARDLAAYTTTTTPPAHALDIQG
jgi:hypothetical protein